jgi:hypothetical protein
VLVVGVAVGAAVGVAVGAAVGVAVAAAGLPHAQQFCPGHLFAAVSMYPY